MNKPVVMGRKTYLSIGKPLKGRTTIVVSRDRSFGGAGRAGCRRPRLTLLPPPAAMRLRRGADEIVVAGGGDIYVQALPLAARLAITEVHKRVDGDTSFPSLDPQDLARDRAQRARACGRRRRFVCVCAATNGSMTPQARHNCALQGTADFPIPAAIKQAGAIPRSGDNLNAVEQPARRAMGFRTAGALGLGTAVAGAEAAGPRGIPAPQPGPAARLTARQSRRSRHRADRADPGGAVGHVRLLQGRAG